MSGNMYVLMLILHLQKHESRSNVVVKEENRQKEQLKRQQLHQQPASETNQYQHRSRSVSKAVQSSLKVNAVTHYPSYIYENFSDEEFENIERSQETSTNKHDNTLLKTVAVSMFDKSS